MTDWPSSIGTAAAAPVVDAVGGKRAAGPDPGPGPVETSVERVTSRSKARSFRPERSLAFERLVRSEIALHRLLATSRRAASTIMSAMRRLPSGKKDDPPG